ncbi:MFS transporter [Amycolatopsis jiangsuensis]|uniref:Sugar phosphate permease n=1 Tax=Amycolatopsis jiangsuensis TaxID=1181879 RepID=A0A840J797_9PSEU|nr:MFS transporter [Amycolatopsis jiangsuensis]MBB4689268.1 sugar phosphate permease [Amycolatopsis jiangsuensis]
MSSAKPSPYRWLVLLLCWAGFTMTSVDRSTWGPASAAVSDSLHVPLAALGIFATCYYIGYVVSNAAGGFLTDWLGSRLVLGVSLLAAGALMIGFGSTTSIPLGLTVQGLVGLFAGVEFSAGMKLITTWLPEREIGRASGIFMTATSLGTVIANAVVPTLVQHADWRASYHLFGGVTVALAVLCVLFLRDGTARSGPVTRSLPDIRPLVRNRDLLLLGLAGFGGLWGTYGFVTWSNTLMIKGSQISPVQAGIVVVIFSGAAVVVKPAVGWLTDRLGLGMRLPIMVILVVFTVALLVFGALRSYGAFLAVAPVLGIAAYAYSPLTAAMIPKLAGGRLTGSAAGGVNAAWQLGSVLVPAVVGPVFHATGSFYAAFLVLAAGPLLGAAVLLGVRDDRPHRTDNAQQPATA